MINKKIKTFLFVMAGLLVLVLLFVLVTTLYQKSVLDERREALIKTISDLWELRDQLEGDKDFMQTVEYAEQRARELGLIKEGETIWKLIGKE